MTTKTELLEIIANGENSKVEFKRDDIKPENLAKELVAFLNLEGGMVILGVEDDGTVSGLTHPKLEEWVMNICRERINPPVNPNFEVISGVDAAKDIAIVQVGRGYAPHAVKHKNTDRYLIRVGTQSRDMDQQELERLFQQRRFLRADLQPITGATLHSLDPRRLTNYFRDIREQETPAVTDENGWHTLLGNTKIMDGELATLGGMLLFGKTPNYFLPHAGLSAAAFPGKEKDYDMQDQATLRGPMTPLLDADGDVVENGLLEQALDFVRRNTRKTARLENGRRIERPMYPEEALRETIVNALIHRDYLLAGTDIELCVYTDRLEVVSPGRLPNGVTPSQMREGVRVARNELIKEVMRDYGYLEHMGMGVPRKIIKGMREHNGTEPYLIERGDRFTVRLRAEGKSVKAEG